MTQKISFVILSFNHPELTARCVRHALEKIPAQNLILYHNGTQERFVNSLKKEFPQIHHEVAINNTGFSGGANAALSCAFSKSPWAFFLTNDTQLLKVPEEIRLGPGFYAPLIWDRRHKHWDSFGGAYNPHTARLRHLKQDSDQLKEYESFYIPGTAFLVHQSVFEELGGFDESYGTFWEDVDFSARVQQKNLVIGRTSQFEVLHLGGKTCHKSSHYTLYLYQRNRWKFTRSHWGKNKNWIRSLNLCAVYIGDFLRLTFRLLRQRRWQDCWLLGKAFCQL